MKKTKPTINKSVSKNVEARTVEFIARRNYIRYRLSVIDLGYPSLGKNQGSNIIAMNQFPAALKAAFIELLAARSQRFSRVTCIVPHIVEP
jgi:hypothetical protein